MNMYVNLRPSKGTKTERVWAIADQISAKNGYQASRAEILSACQQAGIHPGTASTQYSHWKKQYKQTHSVPSQLQTSGQALLQVAADGRLLIPVELRNLMKLPADGKVSAQVVDGELRLLSPLLALERLQALVRSQDTSRQSVSEELIADRRREAADE